MVQISQETQERILTYPGTIKNLEISVCKLIKDPRRISAYESTLDTLKREYKIIERCMSDLQELYNRDRSDRRVSNEKIKKFVNKYYTDPQKIDNTSLQLAHSSPSDNKAVPKKTPSAKGKKVTAEPQDPDA